MNPIRGRARIAALGAAAALLSGCAPGGGDDPPARGATSSPATSSPAAQSAPAGASDGPASTSDAPAAQRIARNVFDRVNAERAERGLAPLEWNGTLAEFAGDWSEDMAGSGRLEHQDMGALLGREELSGFRGIGENIFTASGPVPAGRIHVGWMQSEDHRVNLLNPGWNRIGIGVHCADDGSVWATQLFGRTLDADVPAVTDEVPPVEPIVRSEEDGPTCA